jgi:hypothetical protein
MVNLKNKINTTVAYTFAYQLNIYRFRKTIQKEEAGYGEPCRIATSKSRGFSEVVLYARDVASTSSPTVRRV